MSTDPWQEASDALKSLTEGPDDPTYPMCGGAGEYYECHQAEQRSQLLLDAIAGVLHVLAQEAFWPTSRKELVDRIARSIAYDLSKPLVS